MAAVLKKRALAEYSQTQTLNKQDYAQQQPVKKLCLVKKPTTDSAGLVILSCLDTCKSSKEALHTLLRISDCVEFDPSDIPEAIRRLCKYFRIENESAVKVKILALIAELGNLEGADVILVIDDIINLIEKETSHKVIAQALKTLLTLSNHMKDNQIILGKLIEIAKNYLKDVSHSVKCRSLEMLGFLVPLCKEKDLEGMSNLVVSYFDNGDARVRAQAFSTMIHFHEKGLKLNPTIYKSVCDGLKDDYEIVRKVVLKLLWVLGTTFPENIVVLPDSEQEIRLIDDAFAKICNSVNDLSMHVRTHAAKLLGSMKLVSMRFLNQTLDKKLMSNMRRKRTAHELQWENVTSGEWASGKKWADDAPREVIDKDRINLMSSGSCGAFVHGLEDEYLEVRSASVESLCQLSLNNQQFANLSLDFLVDMFNDEIEDVRLKAIDSLRCISEHITLRDDQLETILGAIEDFSQEIREGLHRMLASCTMSTTAGLRMCVEKLLDNLKKYPQDRRSTYKCLQRIGAQHPELVLPLVPQFLSIHPFFDMAESDVDNPQYICILILVLNAAKFNTTIPPLFEPQTLRHYSYLRDTMPTLVPKLCLPNENNNAIVTPSSVPESLEFLKNVIDNLNIENNTVRMQTNLLEVSKEHLLRLSEMDSVVAGTAKFTSLYIGAQLLMSQILEKGFFSNLANLAAQESTNLKNNIEQLLLHCLKLQYLFVGMSPLEYCAVKQMRLRTLGLNLVYIVKGSNASALAPCHHFLSAVEDMQRELTNENLEPDAFTESLFRELAMVEEPKPGIVARILTPILIEAKLGKIPQPNTLIQMSSVQILEPSGQSDSTLKFTAGLIMAVPFEAELLRLSEPSRLRIKVKYPDQRTQVTLPRPAHIKPLNYDGNANDAKFGQDLRLLTTVLISHQVWSEACNVEISIALAVPEGDIGKRKSSELNPYLIDLCKPVKVSVSPKPIKRTTL
ncbi:PREDICTED: integrator complex subunit 4 [Nicrophorus vespilloides]|uniref:Integrator complex subunit 4 n=1 Tax=Nicrophorus vespilloides TaxID=110193 RepID=A0ABM1NI38_NICVS|nr:PREDICTED: integrator complex subunit 4 [Nicrophorus vespilloides]